MNKILSFALAVLMLFTGTAFSREKKYAEGDVLVVFKAPEGAEVSLSSLASGGEIMTHIANAASEVDSKILDVYETISELDGNIFVRLRSKTKTTEELINELKSRPDVVSVSPNYKVRTNSKPRSSVNEIRPNDARFVELWGLEAIRAPEAWTETQESENIYAAVLDTGFYIHEDLIDNLAQDLGYNAFTKTNDSRSNDVAAHGTHVAGTIGAVGNNKIGVTGVNRKVKLFPYRLCRLMKKMVKLMTLTQSQAL